MIKLLPFLLLLLCNQSFAFNNSIKISKNTDSVLVYTTLARTKEMLAPGQEEFSKKLGSKSLNSKQLKLFVKKMNKKSSYAEERALLNHDNLLFKTYTKKILKLEIRISTLTGNISIENKESKKTRYSKMSKKFREYLKELLTQLQLLEAIERSEDWDGR